MKPFQGRTEPILHKIDHELSVAVDQETLDRMKKYNWKVDHHGSVCTMIKTPWNTDPITKRPTTSRKRVDLRRFVWDLTSYPKISTRCSSFFLNGDIGDYTKENLRVDVVNHTTKGYHNTIFPNVIALFDKRMHGVYGAVACFYDGNIKVVPSEQVSSYTYMNPERRSEMERAVLACVWKAAKICDEYTLLKRGVSCPEFNFLSSVGL